MKILIASGVVVAATLSAAVAQAEEPFFGLLAAKSVRCRFDQGTLATWDEGKLKLEPVRYGEAGAITFDSINQKAGSARIIASTGAGDVALLVTAGALTFLESTGFGSVNVTTVFGEGLKATPGEFIAVTSRHIVGMLGPPMPSQYHGTCRVLQ